MPAPRIAPRAARFFGRPPSRAGPDPVYFGEPLDMLDTAELPVPSAQGGLAKTPFPHLLVYAYERRLTGTIEIATPSGESATILMIEGAPSKARTSEPIAYLGTVLLELGFIDEAAMNASLTRMAEANQLQGQVLL